MQFAVEKLTNPIWNGLRSREKLNCSRYAGWISSLYFVVQLHPKRQCFIGSWLQYFVAVSKLQHLFQNCYSHWYMPGGIWKQKQWMATVLLFGYTANVKEQNGNTEMGILRISINFGPWAFGSLSSPRYEAEFPEMPLSGKPAGRASKNMTFVW